MSGRMVGVVGAGVGVDDGADGAVVVGGGRHAVIPSVAGMRLGGRPSPQQVVF